MVGVLFIVTIPTEQEERIIELYEKHVKFGHSSNVDNSNQENDKSEYGTFKVVSGYSNIVFCFVLHSCISCFVSFKRMHVNFEFFASIFFSSIFCAETIHCLLQVSIEQKLITVH